MYVPFRRNLSFFRQAEMSLNAIYAGSPQLRNNRPDYGIAVIREHPPIVGWKPTR